MAKSRAVPKLNEGAHPGTSVMSGLDPGIDQSSQHSFETDGLPGHPRSRRGQAPGNDDLYIH
jgi:hypothetical protein